jgi:stage V sporulation protein S
MTMSPPQSGTPSTECPVLFVRPSSNVQGLGGAISSSIHEHPRITLRAIGAGAVNQAIKATIHAGQQLAGEGEVLILRSGNTIVKGNNGKDVTAVVIHCSLA